MAVLAMEQTCFIQAFVPSVPSKMAFSSSATAKIQFQMAKDDDQESQSLSFDDAGAAIVDEDEKARAERSGNALSEEVRPILIKVFRCMLLLNQSHSIFPKRIKLLV